MNIEQLGADLDHVNSYGNNLIADNPWFVYQRGLNRREKDICWHLARGSGRLGWSKASLRAAHIRLSDVEVLIKKGVLRKATLFQLAKELIKNEDDCEKMALLEKEGGFLALTDKDDRIFFSSFDLALEILGRGGTPENLEERYQVARRDLYDLINAFLPA